MLAIKTCKLASKVMLKTQRHCSERAALAFHTDEHVLLILKAVLFAPDRGQNKTNLRRMQDFGCVQNTSSHTACLFFC
uniref:Uncharacterized protein n=1 Tax=Anguilla anguilla TaxID=7936 RepID=A0A0E9QRF7_ANGAN